MKQTKTTSIRLPLDLEKRMLSTIVSDGYGLRGKSKWMQEAISDFLKIPNFEEYVDIASEMTGLSKTISLRINLDLWESLEESVEVVRKKNPLLDAARSNLIRASIFQKLLRKV